MGILVFVDTHEQNADVWKGAYSAGGSCGVNSFLCCFWCCCGFLLIHLALLIEIKQCQVPELVEMFDLHISLVLKYLAFVIKLFSQRVEFLANKVGAI